MSDINSIAVTKIAQGTSPQALQGSANSGVLANFAGGGNFWDMLLGNILPGSDKTAPAQQIPSDAKTSADITITNTVITSPQKQTPLAALQLLLSNQTFDENGNIVLPQDALNTDIESLQKQLDLTNQVINHIKNALPENSEGKIHEVVTAVLGKLQSKSENLQASIEVLEAGVISKDTPAEEIPLPLLIALGLNPAEISKITDGIENLEEKLGREITVEDLIAGIGGLIPAAPAPEVQSQIALNTVPQKDLASAPVDPLANLDADAEPTDDLAARLNALNVGGEEPAENAEGEDLLNASEKRAIRSEHEGINIKPREDNQNIDTNLKKAATSFKENLNNILNINALQDDSAPLLAPMFNAEFDGALFPQTTMSTLTMGTVAQAANLTTSATQAGHTHPATQQVITQITKASRDGNTEMNLQLDPPELGTLNIRLSFDKNKNVKAHIIAEKVETHLMLQRDAHALERALQNAGLDARSDSISFELAQGGADNFNNNGEGGGEKNFGGNKSGAANDAGDEIIQSTMTWSVDSETGHVRYNIFA
jgi:hypothetical protein